jgi:hypothetical protein
MFRYYLADYYMTGPLCGPEFYAAESIALEDGWRPDTMLNRTKFVYFIFEGARNSPSRYPATLSTKSFSACGVNGDTPGS